MRNQSHARRRLATGMLGIMTLAASLIIPASTFAAEPAATPTSTPAPTTCELHWPAAFQGKPTTLHAGARAGDYIWHDKNGWHLRVTHKGHGKVVFTGTIVSSTPMTVTPARLEKSDSWTLSADKKTLTYKFNNYGYIDGLNFTTACANHLSIRGSVSGHKLALGRIVIGLHNRHPLSNRFVVVRVA